MGEKPRCQSGYGEDDGEKYGIGMDGEGQEVIADEPQDKRCAFGVVASILAIPLP